MVSTCTMKLAMQLLHADYPAVSDEIIRIAPEMIPCLLAR